MSAKNSAKNSDMTPVSPARRKKLIENDYIIPMPIKLTEGRGRPNIVYALTAKGLAAIGFPRLAGLSDKD